MLHVSNLRGYHLANIIVFEKTKKIANAKNEISFLKIIYCISYIYEI